MNQWEQVIDPVSGRLYYANRSTGKTSWSPPVVPPYYSFPPLPSNTPCAPSFAPAANLQQQQQQIQPPNAQQNTSSNSQSSVTNQFDPSTTTTRGLLVPSIRAIIDKEQTQTAMLGIEFVGVATGTIADLSNVSREWRSRNHQVDGGDFATEKHPTTTLSEKGSQITSVNGEGANQYYTPLQPFSLPLEARPPHVEPGRIEMRLQSLYNKLQSL